MAQAARGAAAQVRDMVVGIYDATLTEGGRAAGVQFSARDKLRIALRLGEMGVSYIEAGWPGGRKGEAGLFREARHLSLGGARLSARASISSTGDTERELRAALGSRVPVVTLALELRRPGRAHVRAAHLAEAIRAVRRAGRGAVVELGSYFDARRELSSVADSIIEAAARGGAEAMILSDSTGGALPHEFSAGVSAARKIAGQLGIGVRARDDAGLAVANSLAAMRRGASLVVTTVNGYGERCGAADLVPIAGAVELKLGGRALAPGQLKRLTSLAHFVAELADREPPRDQPYVGRDAFVSSEPGAPLHADPELVGNRAESAMTDERGLPGALRVAQALGLPARDPKTARRFLARLEEWEKRGFRYEGAEASFDLVLRAIEGRRREYFKVIAYRILDIHRDGRSFTEATAQVLVNGEHRHTAAVGTGPVHALDRALRGALERDYPEVAEMQVVQTRSRNISGDIGTAGPVRMVIESADARDHWGTAGVSDNLLTACVQALVDAIEYKLAKDDIAPR